MSTMTRATNKELTKKQYEFYKRKGMADAKVMEIHDYNNATFNAWKKAHDLIGVKFESDLKVSQGGVSTSSSVDNKPEVFMEMAVEQLENKLDYADSDLQPPRPRLTAEKLQTLADNLKGLRVASEEEYEGALSVGSPQTSQVPLNPINYIDMTAVENTELKSQIIWLEERHVKDTAELDDMRGKYQSEKIRGNKFCDDMIRARRQFTESEAKVSNLLEQIKRQDELLVAADRDRKLLFMTMEKAVEQNKRIQVAAEGGEF